MPLFCAKKKQKEMMEDRIIALISFYGCIILLFIGNEDSYPLLWAVLSCFWCARFIYLKFKE